MWRRNGRTERYHQLVVVLCCGVYVEEEWEDREVSSAGSGVVLWCVCGGGMGGQRGIISCRKPNMCGISTKYHSTCDNS